MLTIRLQRVGKKHQPQFRIVLAEKQKAPNKKIIEILGNYNPRTKEFLIKDSERVKYWLAQNVFVSPTVHNLLVEQKLIDSQGKIKAWAPKKAAKLESDQAADAQETTPTTPNEPVPQGESVAEPSDGSAKSKQAVTAEDKAEQG